MFYSESLPKSATSAALARHALDRLAGEVDHALLQNARLLVSELVSNAVEHVPDEGDIEIRVDATELRLRVEVFDPGPGFAPEPRAAGAGTESGWGLHFVARVADSWGVDHDGRTRVWFELRPLTST